MDNPPSWITYGEFKQQVLDLLPIDAKRIGIQDVRDEDGNVTSEGYLSKTIRQGVIEIQNFIERYRNGHESIYLPVDLVTEGAASRGVLHGQSKFRDAWYWKDADDEADPATGPIRYPVNMVDWEDRFNLVNGAVDLYDNEMIMCIDPYSYTFYVYPEVVDGFELSLFWDGIKIEFGEDDETPFDEQLAGCIADYCKGRIEREVNKDLSAYNSYFHPSVGTYHVKRRLLFLLKK